MPQGFVEFRPYLGACKFRNCRHQQEPAAAAASSGTMRTMTASMITRSGSTTTDSTASPVRRADPSG